MTPPRFRPDHCTAEHPCWECWQGFEPRVAEADIAEAWLEAKLYLEQKDLEFLPGAVWRIEYLIAKQWREMTRQPFIFESTPTEPTTAIDLDELFGS